MSVQKVESGIFQVPIPMPGPLKFVNAYVFGGPSGWSLVDCGFHDRQTEDAWMAAFDELGIKPTDVNQVVVTHYHGDHFGAAGWLQQVTGAKVLIFHREVEAVRRVWGTRDRAEVLIDYFRQNGLSEEMLEGQRSYDRINYERILPLPELTVVGEGEKLDLGGRTFIPIWAPGHTDGLMVLWCETDRILMANDAILAKISPQISRWPDGHPDPLASYYDTLERLAEIPARLVLTGHRQLVEDLPARTRELQQHHQRRLGAVMEILADHEGLMGGMVGWEVAQRLFGQSSDPLVVRFSLAETLAHLEHLAHRGRAIRTVNDVVRYRLTVQT